MKPIMARTEIGSLLDKFSQRRGAIGSQSSLLDPENPSPTHIPCEQATDNWTKHTREGTNATD